MEIIPPNYGTKVFYINISIIKEKLLTVCVKPKIKNEA
ncbi:hypothetical protein CLERM_561 [Coxiella-like endosymbiont]|nr:hypothetical protein CLERM_561 [Coxiella-like endosymbiont]